MTATILTSAFVSLIVAVLITGRFTGGPGIFTRRGDGLTTERLVLVGADGRPCAKLHLLDGSPSLALLDKSGVERIRLGIAEEQPALSLADEQGRVLTSLALTRFGPDLALYDTEGQAKARLFNYGDEDKNISQFVLYRDNQKAGAILGASGPLPFLIIYGEDGNPLFSTPLNQ